MSCSIKDVTHAMALVPKVCEVGCGETNCLTGLYGYEFVAAFA